MGAIIELLDKITEQITFQSIINNSLRLREKFSTWIRRTGKLALEDNISFKAYQAIIFSRIIQHPKAPLILLTLGNKNHVSDIPHTIFEIESIEHENEAKHVTALRLINSHKEQEKNTVPIEKNNYITKQLKISKLMRKNKKQSQIKVQI